MSDTFFQGNKILCGRSALPQLINEMQDLGMKQPLVLCDSSEFIPLLKKHLSAEIHTDMPAADFESAVDSKNHDGFITMGDCSADQVKSVLASGCDLPYMQIFLPTEQCRSITGYYENSEGLIFSIKSIPVRIFFDSSFLKRLNRNDLDSCRESTLMLAEYVLNQASDDPFLRAYGSAAIRLLNKDHQALDIVNASLLAQTAFSNLKLPDLFPGDTWHSFLVRICSDKKESVS